jgi:hypothetical protein
MSQPNDWNDRDSLRAPEPQVIDRIEVIAYMADNETWTFIDAIVRDNELIGLDLKGRNYEDFNCLQTDVYHGLHELNVYTNDYFK